ncbi:SPOR domain-containing protein [candidate division WOR-3 bacterium]|nr:SPOR domain-containing protein [candidate division WOR-3 bacterium]
MYKPIFLIPFLVLGLSCTQRGVKRPEEMLADTLIITEVPAEVETVYVKTVETVVETLRVAEDMPSAVIRHGTYKVQIGAFEAKEYADNVYDSLKGEYGELIFIENIIPYWKVRFGPYEDIQKAIAMRDCMRDKGYMDAWIVPFK